MEHINNAWAKIKAHPKIAIAVAVVIVLIIIASQDYMLNGLLKREHTGDLFSDQERISI